MGPIQPLNILLVEDNPADARLIESYLGRGIRGSVELRTCKRLDEALDLVRRQPPDAVLLDLGLPDSQGLETIDRLAARSDGLPVVVLTGRHDEQVALQAIRRGAQDYLSKGAFDAELLGRTIRYAVERSHAEKSIRASQKRYRTLLHRQTTINDLALALGTTADVGRIYRTLHTYVDDLLPADAFVISHFDRETRMIRPACVAMSSQEHDRVLPEIPFTADGADAQSLVIRTKQPLRIDDWDVAAVGAQENGRIVPAGRVEGLRLVISDEWRGSNRSALLAPMLCQGDILGALLLQCRKPNAYQEEDLSLLSGLANVAAIAIHNAQLVKESQIQAGRLRAAFDGIIETISAAAEIRDPYTAGHQKRVAHLATAIAETLGLDQNSVESVRIASLVHDLGKLGIPAEILTKPSRLTDTETEIIKTHTGAAYRILRSIDFPWPIAETVYQHHERLDGSGYPRGLRGDEVSLEARIIGVADVVEAMASHRPYRPALGLEAALEEVRANIGVGFDTSVGEACLALFEERGFDFDRNEERTRDDEDAVGLAASQSRGSDRLYRHVTTNTHSLQ